MSIDVWRKMIDKIDKENLKDQIDYPTFKKIFLSVV